MRYPLVLIVSVSLLAWPSVSSAQGVWKEAKIERLLELTNADAMMDQVFNQMKAMTASQVPKGTTPEQQAREEQTRNKIMDLIKSRMRWDKMRPDYVKLYSETFSDEEVSGMLAFYESPAGRAMLSKMPVLMGKTMALVQSQMTELMPEIQRITKEGQQSPAK
jgi:uncharacterized protein